MLGTYNVNGAPRELLIDEDALIWWPPANRSSGASNGQATSSKSSQLASPIRHLKRLSNGPKNEDGNSQTESLKERKKRRIDFDQIIGLVRVMHSKKRRRGSKKQPDDGNQATICDQARASAAKQDDSEIRRSSGSSDDSGQCTCLKLYFVKRNESKLTGRLMKLKKMTITSMSQTSTTPEANIPYHETRDRQDSSTSSSATTSTCDSTASADQMGQLEGLCNLIEQHLELKRRQRPRQLLVFVNPFGGKGKALHLYKSRVRKILDLAQVECQLVVTRYANHARDTIEDPMFDLDQFDGIICIGGDGMFAELMNGLLFRFNRDKLLSNELRLINSRMSDRLEVASDDVVVKNRLDTDGKQKTDTNAQANESNNDKSVTTIRVVEKPQLENQLKHWRSLLGGIGEQFQSPNIPIGVIGAGSTDANLFGFIGTNDTVSATLNIVLGNQIQIDVSSLHSLKDDRLLRFVSTFVAYGYFGDVIRESEKLRWLGPSRYDVTALNSLIKYRNYNGLVRVLRSTQDGSPLDLNRCHLNCGLCRQVNATALNNADNNNHLPEELIMKHNCIREKEERSDGSQQMGTNVSDENDEFEIIEEEGSFVGVNAAVTACRCPQTRKGFSPGNHLANGCADLILVRSCSRIQYINYLIRTGFTSKSAFDLGYVDAYRCRQFEFVAEQKEQASSWGNNHSSSDDTATSDYQSKGSTKLFATNTDTSMASSRQSSNTNSLDSKHFVAQQSESRAPGRLLASDADGRTDGSCENDNMGSSWNADGEILREQSIRVKVNNKLLRVFGTGEPQPRLRRRKKRVNG